MRVALVAVLALVGCRDEERPPVPVAPTLAEYLTAIAGTDEASRTLEVTSWELDEPTWNRTVVAAYRGVHTEYTRAFAATSPRLIEALAKRGTVTTRPHFAGDPRLTLGQAQARWALPVQFPAQVVELDGVALDAVFVRDGERWRAITGIDIVLHARAQAIDPACAAHLELARLGQCAEIGWVLADAALLADAPRFSHACSLAANLCTR